MLTKVKGSVWDASDNEAEISVIANAVAYPPFYLLWSGQSNAAGSAEAGTGDRTIEEGVRVYSETTGGWIVPDFSTPVYPVPSSGSNHAGIHCANEIKRLTNRDVYLLQVAQGGESLKQWIDPVASGWDAWDGVVFPKGITAVLTAAGVTELHGVGWMQGEADYDGAGTGYDSYSSYKAGINTLLTQLQSLSQWTKKTVFVTSGVGGWGDLAGYHRNDVLLTMGNDEHEFTGNISIQGLERNPDAGQSSHFNGDSLVKIGIRAARKMLNIDSTAVFSGKLNQHGLPTPKYTVLGGTSTNGTATSNGTTTTIIDTSLTGADDSWVDFSVQFTDFGTTNSGSIRRVVSYDSATKTLVLESALPAATTTSENYKLVTSIYVDPVDLKGGAYFHLANVFLFLPHPSTYDGAEIAVYASNLISGSCIVFVHNETTLMRSKGQFTVSSQVLTHVGVWTFKSYGNLLQLIGEPSTYSHYTNMNGRNGLTPTSSADYSAALSIDQVYNKVYYCYDTIVTLPVPNTPYKYHGARVGFYAYSVTPGPINAGLTTVTVDGVTTSIINLARTAVHSVSLTLANDYMEFVCINDRWVQTI